MGKAAGMGTPHLIIVCGVPGAGKSTLARRAAARWSAVTFASETFAETLGSAARSNSGDLTGEAVAHAYAAMGKAVAAALARHNLVVTVGSFRSRDQREHFRKLAAERGAPTTTLRVVCQPALAAERVRARRALGERGPDEEAIREIDAELNRATDIDVFVKNEGSTAEFEQEIDTALRSRDGNPVHKSPEALPIGRD